VVTRWYRSPEIMLACHEYDQAVDVWAAGCIFAELMNREALFPGEDYIAQLRLIVDKLGKPASSNLDFVTSGNSIIPYPAYCNFSEYFGVLVYGC
jgi:mitogen-activated protein kinase 1/3